MLLSHEKEPIMPYSSDNGKKSVDYIVGKVKPKTALDIGCGAGTYAKRYPTLHWTGVEIWEPYVEKFGLNGLYSKLLVEDAREVDFSDLGHFDIAFAGDVLEHMSKDEAKALLEKLRVVSDTVVVSVPLGHYPQEEFEGNPYEKHVVDDWSDEEVRSVFGEPTWTRIEGEIGVYVWTKHDVRLKICVYAISKNEEKFVKRWADSARDADLLFIADTGSTDGTIQACKDAGVVVHEICITPWRFDHARNASIALIPRDMDVCVSLDVDEMMEPGWREEIERVWVPGTTRLRYYFDWGCGIKFMYEKIHARHGYYWHHPCHEYPRNDARIEEVWAYTDKLLVSHHPDPTKSRGQYLDLLELSVKEDPLCPRNAFYYARELSFHCRWADAIKECRRYLALPGATWGNERCYAYRVMGKSFAEMGDLYNAEINFQLAASEAPNTREPWCELALMMYRQMRWAECFAYSMRALGIKDRALVYTCDPAVWGHWAHDLASISAWHLGIQKIALEQAKLALEHSPDDVRLQNNLKFIEKGQDNEKAA